jgi:hypothetical protein
MRFQRRGSRQRLVAPDGNPIVPTSKPAARRYAGQGAGAGLAMTADAR